jgi:hypothetical protein
MRLQIERETMSHYLSILTIILQGAILVALLFAYYNTTRVAKIYRQSSEMILAQFLLLCQRLRDVEDKVGIDNDD